MKKIAHLLMGRLTIVGVSILLQICWLFLVLWKFSYQFTYANLIIRAAAIVLVLVIANKWENPANKLSWTFLILLSPILGIMLYFLFGRSGLTKHTREQMDAVNREVDACMPVDEEAVRLLQEADPSVLRQSKYIADWGHFPVYRNTATKYYESGEAMFPDMLAALESAEHFIFLEYFIIEEGHMFHQIEDILEKKVKEGVEVRLIYDDVGCIGTLPPRYYKQLQKKGIKCAAFNPFRPLLSVIMNNRDHRKIFVVDGAVGFTGGINLADEYINEVKRVGYWKDTGVRIEGEVLYNGRDIFSKEVDVTWLRKKIGMVFQKPNPFPMSIYDNIAYGPRLHGTHSKAELNALVEKSLRGAALWDEVKDRLKKSALGLSGGQQQRMCIARALAVEPDVLLMDEPTSALDPASTMRIEELMASLKESYTVVIVTHNMQQAARISDKCAFFLVGDLIEFGETEQVFSMPKDKRTEDYITGRFG